MRILDKLKRNENGEIMLESLIVYSVTIMLLFFILAIFSVLYQRWNIQTIANEVAARAAQTYRFTEADFSTGYIEKDEILNIREYRYMFKKDEIPNATKTRVESYALDRLSKTTYTRDVTPPKVEVEIVGDALARRHIEVTITGEYAVPFGEALSYFGFDSTTKYETTAYADCVDLIDYVNTTDFLVNKADDFDGNPLAEMINSFFKLVTNIMN